MPGNPRHRPFTVRLDPDMIADLKGRLERIRWPAEPDDEPGWLYGANLAYMKRFAAHWRDGYDWAAAEARLNRHPQFLAQMDAGAHGDLQIHYVLREGRGPDPLPLVLTHGWPGSVLEFSDIVDALADPAAHGGDPADAFTVICPTLPGYGFSTGLKRPIHPREIAALWARLLRDELGLERVFAAAGDWGSVVTAWLATDHPDRVAAIHLNMLAFRPLLDDALRATLSAEELAWFARVEKRLARQGAYWQIQGTKPTSIGYALSDSPIGLAGWLVEKFQGAPGAPASVEPPFAMDDLIDNLLTYWITNSISTANWTYWAVNNAEAPGGGIALPAGMRCEVPTGFFLPPKDLFPLPPQSLVERVFNVTHRTDAADGGHFVAMDNGPAFVADLRSFFRRYR
ncbi:epoxide hydrolase family protein [Marinibaculum pumilum]|uniref:Epoxide hydrolase family protein n=1 Tax=Marinibaculum pumilum TaxID=1766165 RepID=A0ABV7KX27_9PROT